MTREEAMYLLNNLRSVAEGKEDEAIDMAIEALSAKTDLISRADAMGAVQDHFNANGFKGYDDGQKMMDRIKSLPSADAEQVTSKLNNPCDSLLTDDSAECKEQKSKLESADANQTNGRLINADILMDLLKARKQFFVDAYGGFHCMSEKDKARCDEIDACIASIVNAPTASADAVQGAGRYENAMQKLREMPRYLNGVKEKQITKISDDSVPQMEHDREWVIGCIKHDGFIKTDRFDKANQIILDALSADAEWILCSERLPSKEDCPMDCLVTRKSKFIGNYVDMAVAEENGTWTHEDWDAIVLGDVESGRKTGLISTRDDGIIAWMPLPKPYKGGDD